MDASPFARPHPRHLGAVLAALLLAAAPDGRAQPADVRVHDPVLIEQDGVYHLFSTGRGIRMLTSTDLAHWAPAGQVFEEAPAWTRDVVPDFRNHIWAPDIAYHDGTYYLYYSVSAFGRNTSAIGVATNTTLDPADPAYAWVDHGPVVQSVPGRDLWNAIDPNLVHDDDGTPWLAFGSFWAGLKLVQLDASRTRVAQPETWHTIAARARDWTLDVRYAGDEENGAIEAPFIFRKDGYYYLFASWDRCCAGARSTYKVVAGRARDVAGPYVDRDSLSMVHGGGTLVVHGFGEGGRWYAGGHPAAYTLDGVDYLVIHAYDATDDGASKLVIRPIRWDEEGWPSVTLDE